MLNWFAFFSKFIPVSNRCQSNTWFIPVSINFKKLCLSQHVSIHLVENHSENILENNRRAFIQTAIIKYRRFGQLSNRH